MNGKLSRINKETRHCQTCRIEVSFKISDQNQVSIKRIVMMTSLEIKSCLMMILSNRTIYRKSIQMDIQEQVLK